MGINRISFQINHGETMLDAQQIPDIVNRIKNRLKDAEQEGIYLKFISNKLDDDWLYIVLAPSKLGVRASDHANFMSKIERELRVDGIGNVILVPELTD
jgi:hypothetical protein